MRLSYNMRQSKPYRSFSYDLEEDEFEELDAIRLPGIRTPTAGHNARATLTPTGSQFGGRTRQISAQI